MRPATPTRAPCTRTVPVGEKVPSGLAVRAFFLVIWNSAPVSERLPLRSSYLAPTSKALVLFRRQRAASPVVEVSCSSDGLNEVLYEK